jgi:hypothetical protein
MCESFADVFDSESFADVFDSESFADVFWCVIVLQVSFARELDSEFCKCVC